MSESLSFCKRIASDPDRSRYTDRDFTQAEEFGGTKRLLNYMLGGRRKIVVSGSDERGDKIVLHCTIDFNPNAEFDYITSVEITHDGTYAFILSAIEKCLARVVTGSTYYAKAKHPADGDCLHYTVGNAVTLSEFGDQFSTEDKPWMQERTTVLLPIKLEIA